MYLKPAIWLDGGDRLEFLAMSTAKVLAIYGAPELPNGSIHPRAGGVRRRLALRSAVSLCHRGSLTIGRLTVRAKPRAWVPGGMAQLPGPEVQLSRFPKLNAPH